MLSRVERREFWRRFEEIEEELRRAREEIERYRKHRSETVGVKLGRRMRSAPPPSPDPEEGGPGLE